MENNNGNLLSSVKTILEQYSGTPITIRQLYYRLVAAGTIPNNINSYKRLVDKLSIKGICMVCDDPHPGRRAKDVKIAM